ncbi:MAG: trypsin-like peptidase domain-containing protein [Terriglobales bacterium]
MPTQLNSRVQLTFAAVALVTAASFQSFAQAAVPRLVEESKSAVVAIMTYDDSNHEVGQGTGFFISSEGEIVTNHHVLGQAVRAVARISSGKNIPIATIVWDDSVSDLVCLKVASSASFKSLRMATAEPKAGERVLVIGNPLGLEGTVSDGIVSAVRDLPDMGRVIQITAPISPGSSGSPVLNLRGEVVGVATSYAVGGQNLNFAIPVTRVHSLGNSEPQRFAEWAKSASVLATSTAARLVVRAYFEMEANDLSAALGHLNEAVATAPNFAPAYLWLGSCYARMSRNAESMAAFKKAIALDPADVEAYKRLAAGYFVAGNDEQAIATCLEAIRIRPDDSDSHDLLGGLYLDIKAPEQAMNEFLAAIRLNPDVGSCHESAARLYAGKGQFDIALAEFREAIRLNPSDETAHYDLGTLYLQLGNRDAALQEYRALKTLSSVKAQELLQKLYP